MFPGAGSLTNAGKSEPPTLRRFREIRRRTRPMGAFQDKTFMSRVRHLPVREQEVGYQMQAARLVRWLSAAAVGRRRFAGQRTHPQPAKHLVPSQRPLIVPKKLRRQPGSDLQIQCGLASYSRSRRGSWPSPPCGAVRHRPEGEGASTSAPAQAGPLHALVDQRLVGGFDAPDRVKIRARDSILARNR